MKSFLMLLSLTLFAVYCDGDTISQSALNPRVPGRCHYEGKYYKPGEHKLPGCSRLICSPNGWASVHNCFDSSIEGCTRGDEIDINQPFPECCKRTYTCRRIDGSKYAVTGF